MNAPVTVLIPNPLTTPFDANLSVFADPVRNAHIQITGCPEFSEQLVNEGVAKSQEFLAARHQLQRNARAAGCSWAVAGRFVEDRWKELLAGSPAPDKTGDTPTVPAAVAAAIAEMKLSDDHADTLTRYCAANEATLKLLIESTDAYRQILQQQTVELAQLSEMLGKAQAAAKDRREKKVPEQLTSTFPSILNLIPSRADNKHVAPRYFRILVWNLEAFTRDPRPRTSPIQALRNQVRITVVAAAMRRLDVDLLLVMETGSDVSQAMTHIASLMKQAPTRKDDSMNWEPLVSIPTFAQPEVRLTYTGKERRLVRASVSGACQRTPPAFGNLRDHAKSCRGRARHRLANQGCVVRSVSC